MGMIMHDDVPYGEGTSYTQGTGIAINNNVIAVDADNTPTENSEKPVKSKGVYSALESNSAESASLLKSTVGWTGKNLLKNTASSQTINGVTFTVNADGSVTANGTATAQCWFSVKDYLLNPLHLDAGSYFVNGCNGGSSSTHFIRVTNGAPVLATSYNGETAFNLSSSSDSIGVYIVIGSNQTVSNLVFKPMLRKADITDPTYESYHESVEEEIEQIYADNGVLGAKNLLPFPYYETTKTVDNGTITVNTDGSVTCNGTFTNGANFELLVNTNLVHDKTLLFNGCPSGGEINNKYGVQIYTTAHSSNPLNDVGNGDVSIDANDTITRIVIRIRAGQVLSNLSFYPMLRLASDPDDTYVPYAMTNRELTENLFYKNKELTSSDNLDDITKTGLYYIYDSVPTNSPESTSFCTVIVNQIKGIIQQTVIKSTASAGSIYVRTKSGSPLAWKPWMKFAGTVVS